MIVIIVSLKDIFLNIWLFGFYLLKKWGFFMTIPKQKTLHLFPIMLKNLLLSRGNKFTFLHQLKTNNKRVFITCPKGG